MMNKALVYKEWIKVRWFFTFLVMAGIVIEMIMFLKLGRSFRFAGHEHLWDVIVNKHQFMFSLIKYYPICTGVIIGMAQVLPEISRSRLKLSLHLPMEETQTISIMAGFGSGILILLLFVLQILMLGGVWYYFPIEIVSSVFYMSLPWFIACITAYLLVAFILYEPIRKRKVVNLFISAPLLFLHFSGKLTGAWFGSIWLLLMMPFVSSLFLFYSVYRFKTGVQSS